MKLLLIMLITSFAHAHGEDQLGPHGGFIRMPGTFHIEVVPVNAQKIKIYLLDMAWKNPSVKNSKLEVRYKSNNANCTIKEISYICTFPSKISLNKSGELVVNATREGQKGSTITYDLPLELPH